MYSHFTYIFFNTSTNVLHCNVTRIKKYNQIFTAKKYLKNFFPQINILSTKVDNICATKTIKGKVCLDLLFRELVESNSTQFRVSYNSQKFPGLFVKFYDSKLTGTLLIFKSGKINLVGVKSPNQFLKLDKWIESKINYV